MPNLITIETCFEPQYGFPESNVGQKSQQFPWETKSQWTMPAWRAMASTGAHIHLYHMHLFIVYLYSLDMLTCTQYVTYVEHLEQC